MIVNVITIIVIGFDIIVIGVDNVKCEEAAG